MGLFLFPTGLLTPEDDGLYTDQHEEAMLDVADLASMIGMKFPHPAFSATAWGLRAYVMADRHIVEAERGTGSRGPQFANPTPVLPLPNIGKQVLKNLHKKGKSRSKLAKEILHAVYNDTAIYYEDSTLGLQYGDFSISIEGVCPTGHTYDPVLGMCVPND